MNRSTLRRFVMKWPWVPVLVLAVVLLAVLTSVSGEGESHSSPFAGSLSRSSYKQLRIGESRTAIERRVGKGASALEFGLEGPATEPMDATCLYYYGGEIIDMPRQLCFRDGKLVRKRIYRA